MVHIKKKLREQKDQMIELDQQRNIAMYMMIKLKHILKNKGLIDANR